MLKEDLQVQKKQADDYQEELKTLQVEDVCLKDDHCKKMKSAMAKKHQQLDVLIEDVTKVIHNFCLKLVEVTKESISMQLQEEVKEVKDFDMNLRKVMEQYVLALESVMEEAKASTLKAAGAVLQTLHKAISQAKGEEDDSEDNATEVEGTETQDHDTKEEDNFFLFIRKYFIFDWL
ncbi:hypothetical protein R1flu_017535 [Riccia fluitans]|uniref:Uncharacterized protein n=1 Tax=Riccia fluitans TaxID=41844 RepID=A0ABD1ZDF7_9MARC